MYQRYDRIVCMKDTYESRIINYYDQTFFEYFLVLGLGNHWGMHFGFHDRAGMSHKEASLNLNRVLAEKVDLKPGARVLDAGCGVGGSSIWLAINRGVNVVGITISEKQCAKAKQLAQRHGVSAKTEFFVRNYLKSGFADCTFDVVWAVESVCHAEHKLEFLKEAQRVLKRGGRVIIADGFLKKEPLTASEAQEIDAWTHAWAVPALALIRDFAQQMTQVGFKNVNYQDVTQNVLPFSRWLYYRTKYFFLPLACVLHWFGLLNQTQVDNGIGALGQYETLKKDLWAYIIFTGEK